MKKLEALFDAVIVKPVEEEDTTYGSIVVPDMGKEKPEIGTVMAVGKGRVTNEGILIKTQLKKGQKVIVPKFGAQVVTIEGETYVVASENDILGIIKNKENE